MKDLIEIGSFLQKKREKLGLTREDLCGDEKELTTRQLFRIEHGENWPTLNRFLLITERLGINPSEVLDIKLLIPPDKYLYMKQYLIEVPINGQKRVLEKKEEYIQVIKECYFDILSEEEQLAVSIIESDLDFFSDKKIYFEKEVLPDYVQQVKMKANFSINDLLILRLVLADEFLLKVPNSEVLNLLDTLKNQAKESFGYKATLILQIFVRLITNYLAIKKYGEIDSLIQSANNLMKNCLQFRLKPVLLMLEGQYLLFTDAPIDLAHKKYQQAIICAEIFEDSNLMTHIQKQWEIDLKKARM